jgi:hypothetical protein
MITIKSMRSINQLHASDFTNPLGLLVHCHERIEGQLRALELAAGILERRDQSSLPFAFEAMDMACNFLRSKRAA